MDWIECFLEYTKGLPSPEIFRLWAGISTIAGMLERKVWVTTSGGTIYPNIYAVLVAPPAVGKCLHPDEPVLMFDGKTKRTGDLVVGDTLMGPDSQPRTILNTNPGHGPMFTVVPNKGKNWKCNGDHILVLRKSRNPGKGRITEISVKDWLKAAPWFKSDWKLFRTGVEFQPTDNSVIEPYFVGLFIGDGSKSWGDIAVTTMDLKIVQYLRQVAADWGLVVVERNKGNYNCASTFGLISRIPKYNPLFRAMKALGVTQPGIPRHIPSCMKYGTRTTRLEMLAGLIDSDGFYQSSSQLYEIIAKDKRLAEDIEFVARSLGFGSYIHETMKSAGPGHLGLYYRVFITGGIDEIPCKLQRKQARNLKNIRTVTNVGFNIFPSGEQDWFGITVDGDNRYLLGDFTVTHNSQAIYQTRDLWILSKKVHVAPNSTTKAALLDYIAESERKIVINNGKDMLEYHSLSIASSEFGVLVPSHDTEFLSTLIDIYDNPPDFRENRRHSKSVNIIKPQLNILAGTQPGYLASLLPEEAWSMGFMSRVIMVYSATGPMVELFEFPEGEHPLKAGLLKALIAMSVHIGPMQFGPGAKESVINWQKSGQKPVPEHSKLAHYNGRRMLNMLKLAIISAFSRTNTMLIEQLDVTRAMDWLFAVEDVMPDVFREMVQRSDTQVIQELHFFLWKIWIADKKPIHESRLINFLRQRVPAHAVLRVLEICEKSNIITKMAGTNMYIPRPQQDHGIE